MLKSYSNTLTSSKLKVLPEIVDLFSGCGGLAFGFKSAGFSVEHGIELNKAAANTASYNLFWQDGRDQGHICGDITTLSPELFVPEIGKKGCIVIGGPPCQAYSQIGKAKLRSLGKDRMHTNDSRGYLFQDFVRFVLGLDAKAVVMENVPEAVNYGGINVPQYVCELLEENGYDAYWTILNAADYGVPQVRERVFVLAIKKSIQHTFHFPVPTHKADDDRMTPWQMRFKKLSENKNFREPNRPADTLPRWVTVEEALSDLPVLFPSSKSRYQLFKSNIQMEYKGEPANKFQHLMRNWYGKEQRTVTGHGFRRTKRDFPIFERMKPGDDYLSACMIAEELLEEACRNYSIDELDHPERYEQIKRNIVPPYDRENFHSKWKKLLPDRPSHTLVAHLSVDTYSHLHPWEPRGISVREAARLQSFPDGFLFQCTMGEAFKQIGNAVPPLLSKAIALAMKKSLLNL